MQEACVIFDWRNPNYSEVFQKRLNQLAVIRSNLHNPAVMKDLKAYYRSHPADFINDWGIIVSPKNVELGLPSVVPFLLYPRQREWIEWVHEHWKGQKPGLTEKTRQMGFSWLAMAMSCTLCLFHEGMVIGVGSRKEAYCDVIGDPKSLIEKGRLFMRNLPLEFRGGWEPKSHAPHMRLIFPETGALIAAEAGDNIGRGATTSLYWVDESAHLEHPVMTEASLSQTTNCRIDISTPNGLGNPFAQKRFGGNIDVFTFHWTDDPSKDQDWYEKQVAEKDPVTVAQEIDINYSASVEGVLIPNAWVMAAMDAHINLGITPTGSRAGALDVADEGSDLNAFCGAHGIAIEMLEEWSGKGDDIFGTVQRAFGICDVEGYREFRYDADGLGAGVRGDARIINQERKMVGRELSVIPFRGSGPVHDPEGEDVKGRLNKDFFANAKAQSWWSLRTRFQKTHRWIVGMERCNPDDIISIPRAMPNAMKLMMELSQPTFTVNPVGKIVVDKAPEGAKSPNLADAVMIRFCVGHRPMKINAEALMRMGIRV